MLHQSSNPINIRQKQCLSSLVKPVSQNTESCYFSPCFTGVDLLLTGLLFPGSMAFPLRLCAFEPDEDG